MLNPARPSKPSFHYISPPSPNPYYLLLLDITRTLEALESCKTQLANTPFFTSDAEYIRPVECDQVAKISRDIREAATKLAGKLGLIGNLHGLPGATYYKLNMYLRSAEGKSQKLDELIRRFRPICMQNTRQQRDTFASVQEAIRICMQVCEQVQRETEAVLDTILLKSDLIFDFPTELLQKDHPGIQHLG